MTDHAATPAYVERLRARVAAAGTNVCVGLDPSLDALRLVGFEPRGDAASDRVARADAIEQLCMAIIDGAADAAAAIKPQMAHFEAAGAAGIAALEHVVAHARAHGLLVVLDAKRCDIPHSARAYAEAWLGADASSGCGGDALTVAVWPGPDTLSAFADVAGERGCGIYALALTSNPGADMWLDAPLAADGRPLWQHVASAIESSGAHVGAVVGATHPGSLQIIRTVLPTSPLLVPGIGAQGGDIAAVARLDAACDTPSLVNVSRSVLPTEPASAAEITATVAANVRALGAQLQGARNSRLSSDSANSIPVG